MPSLRPSLILLIVPFSVFAVWEALSFLNFRVFKAKVEFEEQTAVHRVMPPTQGPMIYKDVTTATTGETIDVPTESSTSMEENGIDWMQRQEEKFNERRLRVETVCRKYKDVAWTNKHVGKEFLFDIDNGLACCRHGKASV